jgi:hypothetical protein
MAELTPEQRAEELEKELNNVNIESCKRRYEEGDKYALLEMMLYCSSSRIPPPKWVDETLIRADELYQTGQLKSWDEIFGKSFPGKRRAGLLTRSRDLEIFVEARRLKEQYEMAEDRGLFEQVAENLQIGKETDDGWTGWATVRDIYFAIKKDFAGS